MTDELGSAQAKRVGDLKTKIPEVVGKLPKGDPNKKKAQKVILGTHLLTYSVVEYVMSSW